MLTFGGRIWFLVTGRYHEKYKSCKILAALEHGIIYLTPPNLLSTSLICLFQIYDGDGSKIKNDKLSPFSEKQEQNAFVPWLRANIESLNLSWKTNKGKSSNQNSKSEKFKLEYKVQFGKGTYSYKKINIPITKGIAE